MKTPTSPLSSASPTASLLIAGFGCRRGCGIGELRRLLETCLSAHGLSPADLHALASLDSKLAEPGLQELASQLGLPLQGVAAEHLLGYEPRLTSLSDAARRATGCAGVAEASALAVAETLGGTPADLLIAKQRSANATFALARARLHPTSENA